MEPLPADSPLWAMPNVLISPHSASTVGAEDGIVADIFCRNCEFHFGGRQGEMINVPDKAIY